jgi:hypothetical protein
MKRSCRVWIPLFCIVALFGACSSSDSGKSETELAIQQFYDRLGAEDYPTALGYYSMQVREMLEVTGGGVDESYIEWAREETKQGSVERVEIVNETVEAETADIKYRVVYDDGSTAERTVSLTREEGEWKLGFIDNV